MTHLQTIDPDELRIILAFEFEQHAAPSAVAAFKQTLINSQNTVHGVETTGSFNMIVEVAAPNLPWLNDWLKSLAEPLSALVKRQDSWFVCKRFIRRPENDNAIWVPTRGSLKRIDARFIDKVSAEGDYVRVYARGESWLIHATLHSILEKLSRRDFVQIHRSMLLRRQFIQELRRDGDHWVACLRDRSEHRVAKSHASEVMVDTRLSDPNRQLVES
jgi:hypothetical protein